MINGILLSLMAGPVVPRGVSAAVVDALVSAQVTISARGASGFQLVFSHATGSPLTSLLPPLGGSTIPLLRIVLVATVNGVPEVLSDGLLTHHEITPGSQGSPATLTLTGQDLTTAMDLIELNGVPFASMSYEARAALILLKYAGLGVVPRVIPTPFPEVPNLLERIAQQRGTDLAYLRSMAAACGYVFYVEPGPSAGKSVGYWGPEIKVGTPQPALNVDMDLHTNVESISFRLHAAQGELPVAYIRPAAAPAGIPVPVPDVGLINPPLGLQLPGAARTRLLSDTAKMSLPQALLFGLAQRSAAADCVSASGTLDVLRYGRLLKARKLVGLRGAGREFDGLYYVSRLTHEIERGRYRQHFELTRNALASTVAKVSA